MSFLYAKSYRIPYNRDRLTLALTCISIPSPETSILMPVNLRNIGNRQPVNKLWPEPSLTLCLPTKTRARDYFSITQAARKSLSTRPKIPPSYNTDALTIQTPSLGDDEKKETRIASSDSFNYARVRGIQFILQTHTHARVWNSQRRRRGGFDGNQICVSWHARR